jgi:hypothetical protein
MIGCMKKLKIVMEPEKGSSIVDCAKEALRPCIEHDSPIEFMFNGTPYRVDPKDFRACIKEIGK